MKKIWTRISSAILASLMLFSTALPVSAYTSKDLASDEKTDTPYYADYTFDQFYALPDAELEQIFEECDTYHENIQFRCAYATLEQCDAMVEKYGDSAESADSASLDAFCAELGIPRKYVDAVQFHHSPDETYQMNLNGESSTLYRSFDIYTTFQYKLPAITLWKEESKVANIIATLLVLNPDVYVDLSLTYLGYGVNPAIYHAGDVNWDGVIDISDAVLLSKIVTTGTQCQYVTLADCDGNGEVDSRDVVALMMFLIHLVDTLPCAE